MGGPVVESQMLRSLASIEYREYKEEDNMSFLVDDSNPVDCDIFHCWVAVQSGTRVVIGVVVMSIPKPGVPDDARKAINAKRPKGCKHPGGAVGFIYKVIISELWKADGIDAKLLLKVFEDLPRVQRSWDVVYTYINPANFARIILYEKLEFMKIMDKVGGNLVAYARFNT
ncbi:hypothetical protein Pmar_PMAR008215 [Perkinsus marinus ATCC 50983]|uniref:N-acetyltransferase domain-containing protein n=1 Tax=Perkinsus marinus (strain ATCC 50983 / TXsc) TaxID=423536 RepID=C5LTM5_PERM5|nr:hypothetical protein Pmar_PMAR008215 [Perkinsus marinus ATCC 50983]EEQ99917.1 hypothetical protein Pmar_PMAR008215 [Perkinsus marinus ATCC 50983]|eukprot:XP_002767200.1 hypothetical protein Pmar_PMAR008215 [Perkinsus marinus ATCC 50983]